MLINRQRIPHPATFLPWLVTAFSLLWLKRDLLIELRINPVLLSKIKVNETFFTDVACMRIDIPLLFLVIPLLLAVVLYFVPGRWRLALLTTAFVLLEVVVYTEGRSLTLVGQFASLNLLLSAISWGTQGGGATDYLPVSGLIKLVVALAALLACAFIAHRLAAGNSPRNALLRKRILIGYLVLAIFISAGSWFLPSPPTRVTTSIASVLFKSFLGLETNVDQTKGLESLSMTDLHSRYRVLTQAPMTERDPAYWGIAKGQNVIFVVWETGPARYLDLTGDLKDLPNMARLREHALIGTRHYSTYPYTNRAQLSIYTSLYPYAKKNFQSFPHRTLPGAISTLRSKGYETGVYGSLWTGEDDQNMYKSIGFDVIGAPMSGAGGKIKTWQQRLEVDRESLKMLQSDIEKWDGSGEKYAAAFLPEIGHGPWPDMSGDDNEESIAQRGRALTRLEDEFIGQLLTTLERDKMLSNTIIVVTSDHGVRDKVDDPSFDIGMIDNYSYHVPLMVYSSAIPKRIDIPWVTSHIDISPTVLDLLGVASGRTLEEGAPIWQRDLSNRTTFFLASHYMGADGYYRNNKFFTEKYLSGLAYESPQLHFDGQPLPYAQTAEVIKMTGQLDALQAAMFYKFAFDEEK